MCGITGRSHRHFYRDLDNYRDKIFLRNPDSKGVPNLTIDNYPVYLTDLTDDGRWRGCEKFHLHGHFFPESLFKIMNTTLCENLSFVDHRHAGTEVLGLVKIVRTQKDCFSLI